MISSRHIPTGYFISLISFFFFFLRNCSSVCFNFSLLGARSLISWSLRRLLAMLIIRRRFSGWITLKWRRNSGFTRTQAETIIKQFQESTPVKDISSGTSERARFSPTILTRHTCSSSPFLATKCTKRSTLSLYFLSPLSVILTCPVFRLFKLQKCLILWVHISAH